MTLFLETAEIWLPGVITLIVLIIVSAFFSAAESGLFSLSREELRRMNSGKGSERLVAQMMREPDHLLTSVLFWNLMVNLSFFAISLATARRLVSAGQGNAAAILGIVGFILMICFGEVAPKFAGVLAPRSISLLSAWPMAFCTRLLNPVLPLLDATTGALRRAFWPRLNTEPYLMVEDLERAVETSESGVELAQLEQQMLSRVLMISTMTTEELMRPRGTYDLWSTPISLEEVRAADTFQQILFIADDDPDIVTRALVLTDEYSLPRENIEALADPVIYVPWCATVSEALALLRDSISSVAAVVNEYGETIGVIAEGDIMDTLINPMSSRGARLLQRDTISFTDDGSVLAEGVTNLRHLEDRLDMDLGVDDDSPVTIQALLQEELERFPGVGDECEWRGLKFVVATAGDPGDPIQVKVEKLIHPES